MNVSSELVPEYLFRVVDFNYDWIQGQRTGTGVPHVPKDLKTIFKVNYPPLPQQKKISKIISTVDSVIEKTESAIAKYQAIKQGLMHDLFTRGIDVNTGKLRPTPQEAPDLFKESALGLIPRDWEVDELGEFIEAIDPQPSHRTPPEFHNGTPYLGINDIQNGEVQLSKCRLVNPEVLIEHKKRYSISEGDIIFGKIGTIGSPKRLSLPQSYSLSANVILIKPFRNKDLVYHYLNSKNVENQISRKIHTTSQPAFGMEKIRSLLFFNIPQIETNILEKKLNSIDQKIQTEQQALAKYQQLKAGLLQDLLTGRVAVSVEEEI
ncbi:restriction endonuclease subunit S [Maribacter sp.]|uniref:restriction endonuclease subunit S n=1 Tax=Maribacter sp. TaxID=1897614 RepID=UPI003297A2B6